MKKRNILIILISVFLSGIVGGFLMGIAAVSGHEGHEEPEVPEPRDPTRTSH